MIYNKIIKELTEEILCDQIDYLRLKEKLAKFKLLLLKITGLDLEKQLNREDLQFKNGIALGSTWAALCTEDIIRTRQFVRGVFQAVTELNQKKVKPIRILYAGTGPFATLILPLLTKFTHEELRLILLEVNPETIKYLRRLIEQLGIGNYIESIINEDASKYQFETKPKVDILLSETMQYGLQKEQQVPITLNLINQLDEDVILIPSKIKLELALMNSSSELIINNRPNSRFKVLKSLLEFDKRFVKTYLNKNGINERNEKFELCKRTPFREGGNDNFYDKLVILTTIEVYNGEWIGVDLSSLTIPKELIDIQRINNGQREISISYAIKSIPDFEFEFS